MVASDGVSFARQRCAWCGALLDQVDFTEGQPNFWQPGALVTVHGDQQYLVKYTREQVEATIPNSCWAIDHEVTR